MTTPTTQPDRMTAAELRAAFDLLHVEIAELRADIAQMKSGLQQAAAQPAPMVTEEMMINTIIMTTDDNGRPAYKAKGAPYQKHGVRVWDEVLPALGINPETLKPGQNAITPAIRARVQMNPPTEEGKTAQPRKVIGKI